MRRLLRTRQLIAATASVVLAATVAAGVSALAPSIAVGSAAMVPRPAIVRPVSASAPASATGHAVRLDLTVPAELYWKLPVTSRVVALTFDAGSDLGYTVSMLNTLKAKGVHATFGITGDWASAHPDMVRRMAAEGHQVMNHTMHHKSLTGVSSSNVLLGRSARQADVRQADDIFTSLTGHTTVPFFRPPYGDTNASVQADLGGIGYRFFIMWTIDTLGWHGMSASGIISRVITKVVPGAIIAGHVGSASQDGPALGPMIDALRARGYSFVTVAEGFGV